MPTDRLSEAICSKVAQLLKHEREKRGLSLSALSQQPGLSRQSLGYVEQEKRIPNLYTLLRITLALGVDLEKIVGRARKQASSERK